MGQYNAKGNKSSYSKRHTYLHSIAALFMSREFIILTVQIIFHKFVSFFKLVFIFREITLLVLNVFFMINVKGFPLVALCCYQQEMFLNFSQCLKNRPSLVDPNLA